MPRKDKILATAGIVIALMIIWKAYNSEMVSNRQVIKAEARETELATLFLKAKPIKNSGAERLEIEAKSAMSVLIGDGQERILFSKDTDRKLAIASLTKLMTAAVVLENYDPDKILTVSRTAVSQEEDLGNLKVGEELSVKNLLYLMLIESSNDAAYALAEEIGSEKFIGLMQIKTEGLGMKNTFFIDPKGVDPDEESQPFNYSTAKNLALLVKHLLPDPVIWNILSSPDYELYSPDGSLHHILKNTNELLKASDSWAERIIGGKTGWTPISKGCLILVLEAPKGRGVIINVILGSGDRFEEMRKLVNWVHKAYIW